MKIKNVKDNEMLSVQMTQEEYNRMVTLYTQWQDSNVSIDLPDFGVAEKEPDRTEPNRFEGIYSDPLSASKSLDILTTTAYRGTTDEDLINKCHNMIEEKLFNLEALKTVFRYMTDPRFCIEQTFVGNRISQTEYDMLMAEMKLL